MNRSQGALRADPAAPWARVRARSPSLTTFLRRFSRCERGVSATEFALTMPIFIIVIGGLVTIGQAQSAVQNTTLVASTIADLTSQLQTATPADIADEFAVATIMMAPLPTAPLSIRVTSAVPVISGTTVVSAAVGWCQANIVAAVRAAARTGASA